MKVRQDEASPLEEVDIISLDKTADLQQVGYLHSNPRGN